MSVIPSDAGSAKSSGRSQKLDPITTVLIFTAQFRGAQEAHGDRGEGRELGFLFFTITSHPHTHTHTETHTTALPTTQSASLAVE